MLFAYTQNICCVYCDLSATQSTAYVFSTQPAHLCTNSLFYTRMAGALLNPAAKRRLNAMALSFCLLVLIMLIIYRSFVRFSVANAYYISCRTMQSCPWVGSTRGLGWVGSRFCSFWWVGLGWIGWVEYDKITIFFITQHTIAYGRVHSEHP